MITVDVTFQCGDLTVTSFTDEGDYPPRKWWATCSRGHHAEFSTRSLTDGSASCMPCSADDVAVREHIALRKRQQSALDAGLTDERFYE